MQYIDTIKLRIVEVSNRDFKKIIFLCSTLALIMLVTYGFLVAATVSNLVSHSDAKARITEINSELGGLEAKYISLSKSLTSEKATGLGFVSNSESLFIVLSPESKSSFAEAGTVVR